MSFREHFSDGDEAVLQCVMQMLAVDRVVVIPRASAQRQPAHHYALRLHQLSATGVCRERAGTAVGAKQNTEKETYEHLSNGEFRCPATIGLLWGEWHDWENLFKK